jgi:hypothetical protein
MPCIKTVDSTDDLHQHFNLYFGKCTEFFEPLVIGYEAGASGSMGEEEMQDVVDVFAGVMLTTELNSFVHKRKIVFDRDVVHIKHAVLMDDGIVDTEFGHCKREFVCVPYQERLRKNCRLSGEGALVP